MSLARLVRVNAGSLVAWHGAWRFTVEALRGCERNDCELLDSVAKCSRRIVWRGGLGARRMAGMKDRSDLVFDAGCVDCPCSLCHDRRVKTARLLAEIVAAALFGWLP